MKAIKFLFSTSMMAMLFVVFATSLGIGTFIESYYDTITARVWVYNATWFEVLIILFTVNFLGNIQRYQLFKKEKLAILVVHFSFLFIIVGAFITRYISYEGMMPIREGSTANSFLSEKVYLNVTVNGLYKGDYASRVFEKDFMMSEHTDNYFQWNYEFDEKDFNITYVDYYENAIQGIIPSEEGKLYITLVESASGQRHDHYICEGEVVNIHNTLVAFNKETEGAINLISQDDVIFINSYFKGEYLQMATQETGEIVSQQTDTLKFRSLYTIGHLQFVIPNFSEKGELGLKRAEQKTVQTQQALVIDIEYKEQKERFYLMGGKGYAPTPTMIKIEDLEFYASFGSKNIQLPFAIQLKDFIADKYPGTENGYSSFKSKIKVIDNPSFDYEIYMNHILDYKGYRFFQASFDADEKGTVLSVNHDFWGTNITYIGYTLLYISLLGLLFYGKTHFKNLAKQLKQHRKNKTFLLIIGLICFSLLGQAQQTIHKVSAKGIDSLIISSAVSKEQAYIFGKTVVQDDNGRMKPINTFSSEFLRKISKKETFKSLNADQVMLSIQMNPVLWYQVNFIYLKKQNDSLRKLLGIDKKQKYAKMVDFFDDKGKYKLAPYLQEAYATNTPSEFQKDFRDINLRLGLLSRALNGELLNLFPIPNDPNNKWISSNGSPELVANIKDTIYTNFVKNGFSFYLQNLYQGKQNEDYSQAEKIIQAIQKNQRKLSANIVPSESKIDMEILYNRFDIFKFLFSYYMYVSVLMFILVIINIFNERKWLNISINILKWLIIGLFALHTLGLILRWYISGHAPWSDAYESMIYVAWATMGIGVAFGLRSSLTIAATTFVASIILMVAHWNWLDPSIANLEPVLNSYWLMIHVAVIVGSYGPFTLGMILGLTSLIIMIFTNTKNKNRIKNILKELTIINEMVLTIGLIMLAIGNFLGGQWANESWGRYWGWDPKETWALVSIMVYAFVLHMRLIPKMKGFFALNFASVIAYASIIMTYFGVNFYLTGLHSYASGDKVVTPNFVYYSILAVAIITLLAYPKYKKLLR